MTDRPCRKQVFRRSLQIACGLVLLVAGLSLVGCGKKPGSVDPPPEVTNDNFPLVYPDPATDPKP